MPVQGFLKANFRKSSMWNNSLKVLTHEYCKKVGVLLELKKGFYYDFLDYTKAGRFRSNVRMSLLTVTFLAMPLCSEMFLKAVGPTIHPIPLLVQKVLRALSWQGCVSPLLQHLRQGTNESCSAAFEVWGAGNTRSSLRSRKILPVR